MLKVDSLESHSSFHKLLRHVIKIKNAVAVFTSVHNPHLNSKYGALLFHVLLVRFRFGKILTKVKAETVILDQCLCNNPRMMPDWFPVLKSKQKSWSKTSMKVKMRKIRLFEVNKNVLLTQKQLSLQWKYFVFISNSIVFPQQKSLWQKAGKVTKDPKRNEIFQHYANN